MNATPPSNSLIRRAASAVRRTFGYEKGWNPTDDAGWVNTSWDPGFWQQNLSAPGYSKNSVVDACIAVTAQTVSTCPIFHTRETGRGGKQVVTTSALSRLLHRPNEYWSRSDFFLNMVVSLYTDGNAYAYIGNRNDRNEPESMHLLYPKSVRAFRTESGEIFYAINHSNWDLSGDFDVADYTFVPIRDMVHVKLHTPRDPLRGVSPIESVAMSMMANNAMMFHEANFFQNMSRPSGVLSTDASLTPQQSQRLRAAWEERSKNLNTGGVPILSNGLKWQSMSITSQDSQLVEALRFTVEDISRAFRVPLPMLNSLDGSTFNNAESMINWWLSSGLGFVLDHIEQAFVHAFRLPVTETIDFDTNILLRSDFKSRIDALGSAVLSGIYSPNEARAKEGLDAAVEGDEPRVQQQVVPLSYYAKEGEREDRRLEMEEEAAERAEEEPEEEEDIDPPEEEEEDTSPEEEERQYQELLTKLKSAVEQEVA